MHHFSPCNFLLLSPKKISSCGLIEGNCVLIGIHFLLYTWLTPFLFIFANVNSTGENIECSQLFSRIFYKIAFQSFSLPCFNFPGKKPITFSVVFFFMKSLSAFPMNQLSLPVFIIVLALVSLPWLIQTEKMRTKRAEIG